MEFIYYEIYLWNILVISIYYNRNEMNFFLVGLGVFKLKYFLRCGDGSEVCFVLLVLRCLCYYYERVVFYIVWCIDKYLV